MTACNPAHASTHWDTSYRRPRVAYQRQALRTLPGPPLKTTYQTPGTSRHRTPRAYAA